MGLFSHSKSKHTLQEELALANSDLENARQQSDHKKALKLADSAISKIKSAEKIFTTSRKGEPTLNDGIANAYHEHGLLLEKLDHSSKAETSYVKAIKWGRSQEVNRYSLSAAASSSIAVSVAASGISTVVHQTESRSSVVSFKDNIVSEASPSKVKDVMNTTTGDTERIPHTIFNNNVAPPNVKYDLPEIGGLITSTSQLTYCLQLMHPLSTSDEEFSSDERKWSQAKIDNPGEQERLQAMTTDLIREFASDQLKNQPEVDEVVWLAPALNQTDYRKLLQILIDGINNSTLLEANMVDGLVRLMKNPGPREFDTDDLVKILDLLCSKLKNTHEQSSQQIYKLTLAVSAVLDSMADNNVTGLSREQLHGPLFEYLECLQDRPEPYLIYQAAYTFQALQYVPDDESRSQAIQRNGMNLLQGVIGVATGVKGMDIGSVVEGLMKIRDTASEIAKPFIFNIKANIESGQDLMSSLKEGFCFKRDWYPALRAIDISLQSGRLSEMKQLVNQVPSYRDPAFQLGLCQRLGELSNNPLWDMKSRQESMELLVEIYKNDTVWGQHEGVKRWILHILRQSQDSSDGTISERAHTLLQDLKTDNNARKQDVYDEYEKESPSSYPLMIALPPSTSRLFSHIQLKPSLSVALNKLRLDRLEEGREELYISPRAKRNLNAKEEFDLRSYLEEFLTSNKTVFLLLGDSGAGKSTFNRALETELWEKNSNVDKRIPLFIHLPSINNPDEDLITKHLQLLGFIEEHIQELKKDHELILICDGYDETQSTTNLYMSNRLNQSGGWRAQMVISCRTEYNGVDYKDRFQPIDRNTSGTSDFFQEAVIVPFNKNQIQVYIEQYLSIKKSTETRWGFKDYEQVLKQVPTLYDLVKNPFLLRIAMEVLPQLVDSKKDVTSQRVSRIALYDKFMELWLERNRKRLAGLKMKPVDVDAFDEICESGFIKRGIGFIRDMAAAIYLENDGKPVVTYSNESDRNTWKDAFFSKKAGNQILQQAIPLMRNGNQYRFIHKSILEYGLTLSVFDPNTLVQAKESSPNPSRRGSNSSILSFEIPATNDSEVISIDLSLMGSPLGKKSFIGDRSIIQFLVDRVQQHPVFRDQLLAMIERSKTDKNARIAAANAITILIRTGEQFIGADLRGIKIPGADLSFGMFDSADLEGADLRKTSLRNIWLHQAKLDRAQMDGVQFGELPLLQEDDEVYCCLFSSNGSILATGMKNGDVSLYETSTWKKLRTLKEHTDVVRSVSFSTTNNRLSSGSDDSTLRLWDVDTGECVQILQGHSGWVMSVMYSPKGDRIASGSCDDTVRLWDVNSSECVQILKGHSDTVVGVVYSPNGNQIASGSLDSTVRLWNVDTGECVQILQGHSDNVMSVAYSPKGDQLASGSDDRTVRLWDVNTGECVNVLQGHDHYIWNVVYSPKGDQIASGSYDRTVRLWDVDAAECVNVIQGHGLDVTCVVYSPKGDRIASGSGDKTVRLWDVDVDKEENIHNLQGHSSSVYSVNCSPKGNLIASGSHDHTVRLWDADTGECVNILEGHSDYVRTVAYSPKGDRIASGSGDSTVRMWDVDTGKCVNVFQDHDSFVNCVVYSPKGDRIASVSGDRTVRLWDVNAGECVNVLEGHTDTVYSVRYSPKGDQIASVSGDKTVRLWNVNTGECVNVLNGHVDPVYCVVYSPKGDQVASGSQDNTIRLWDVDTGECVHILLGHDGWVSSTMYSPKGDWIASGSLDKTVRLWDVETGQCLTTISGFNGVVSDLVLNGGSGSLFLVTGSWDKSVRRWRITNEGDEHKAILCWSTSHDSLTVVGSSFRDVHGLSQLNRNLLTQRGASILT